MLQIAPLIIKNREVLPIVEGGKGISVSNGQTCGAWAKAGGVGTFSGVNADYYDENGNYVEYIYNNRIRKERQHELIEQSVKGGIAQAKIAKDIAGDSGSINMNILWEMGGAQEIVQRILEGASGCIDGVTCGAGMPYKIAEITSKFNVLYYPIISSARAFNALYRRSFSKHIEFLGGVVYEDPWKAGGHNGLSNAEDPLKPQMPYFRLIELRKLMNEFGLSHVPLILAGNVWWLSEYVDYINNEEIGKIAFQFGTRSILTKENPICEKIYKKMMALKDGDILLTKLSPTGFYSSAVKNDFLQRLLDLNDRQIGLVTDENCESITIQHENMKYTIAKKDEKQFFLYVNSGFRKIFKTPDNTIIFTTQEDGANIIKDQVHCMGCLSACRFSGWSESEHAKNIPDARSFCIQKTLQNFAHDGDIEKNLMFCGHNGYKFASDPFYANGFIPTTKELVDRIMSGY